MTTKTHTTQTSAIKDVAIGGVWRSRRTVAAIAIAGAMSFGFIGASVHQADAGIGWCRSCWQPNSVTVQHTSKSGVVTPYGIGWCRSCWTP